MLRISYERLIQNPPNGNVRYIEGSCHSTDSKPTEGIATGSLVLEVDTAKIYAYDETTQEWGEMVALGGTSSTSGGDET